MKKLLWLLLATSLSLVSAQADENVRAAQAKLREGGFYFGNVTGTYDSPTAAAVTRFQIRRGLSISGRLDAATAQALGVAETTAGAAAPSPTSGTWRRLRNGDMQFLKELNSGAIAPPKPPVHSAASTTAKAPVKAHAETPAAETAAPSDASAVYGKERLRDFVGAFILAGLDPQIGAELEFFADRVNYFGEAKTKRTKIRADLVRYDRRWPQRRFWLAGEVEVEEQGNGLLRVTFPLRYELRSGSERASGKVSKTLVLRKASEGDLEIVGVNERKS